MLLTDSTSLIFKGIKPLHKLGVTARNLSFHNPFADMIFIQNVPSRLAVVPPDPWPGNAEHGRDLIAGVYEFAGQRLVREEFSWDPEFASDEWYTTLHSFGWLRDLRSVGGDKARIMARESVRAWMDIYSKSINDRSWRIDMVGNRLKSWITFYDFFCSSADSDFKRQYFTAIARQARYLSNMLDMPDVMKGIPLMHALRGLAYAGIALDGAEDYLERAFSDVLDEIKEQILPDGGHISRNPNSTFEFLLCLVDLRSALISAKIEVPEELQHAIDRIAPAIKFFRHQDSALAQFNGGSESNAYLCETILMHSGANGKAMKSLTHSGYESIQKGRSRLLMDVGLPLLSKYSDRVHAGLFSFEYSYGRERIIVNCGTSTIKGKWRELLRSTLAHSTLTVDNHNSCHFDDDGLLSNLPMVSYNRHEEHDTISIEGTHSGYMANYGLSHNRMVKLEDKGDSLIGEDQLSGKVGVPFSIRFHLHPNVRAITVKGGEEAFVTTKSGNTWVFRVKGANISVEESIYCNQGSTPRRAQQIVFAGDTTSTTTKIKWEMHKQKS